METKVDAKFDSIRNNEIIEIENYKCCQSNVLKYNTVRFRCANKKCGSSVLMSPNKSNIIKINNTSHNHPACTPKTLALNQVKSAVKRKADIDLNSIPGEIIPSTLLPKPEDDILYSDLSSIRQCIYRVR